MKKIKNYFKPAISIVLLIVMVFCNCTFVAAQTEQDAILEWTNLDSICVKLKTQSHNTFTPEDFPEINCKRVVVYDKEITDDGYFYEAVLVVSYSSVDNYIDNQLSAILNNEYVVTATENTNRKQLLDIYIMGGGHYNELYIGQSTSSGISKDYLYEHRDI